MSILLEKYLEVEKIRQINAEEFRELERKTASEEVLNELYNLCEGVYSTNGGNIPFERRIYELIYQNGLYTLTDCIKFEYSTLVIPYINKKLGKNKKILDVGCGTGLRTVYFAITNPQKLIVSLDINPLATKETNQKAKKYNCKNLKTIQGDLLRLPFKETFDFILCSDMIHESSESYQTYNYQGCGEIYDANMELKFQNLINALKKGGKLLISQSNCDIAEAYAVEMRRFMVEGHLKDIEIEYLKAEDRKILEIIGTKQ